MTIKYPNGKTYEEVVKDEKKEGIIKRKRNGLADRANMGMHLENDVIKSCDYYRNLGIASIYKRPTPIRVYKVDKSNPNKIIEAHFDQNQQLISLEFIDLNTSISNAKRLRKTLFIFKT